MTAKNSLLLSLILIVSIFSAACPPDAAFAAPELPGGPVPVSEEAADQLDQKIIQAYLEAYESADGSFALSITDEEATSWFFYRVATEPENNIADPQIRFTEDKIYSGTTMTGILPFELRIKVVAIFEVIDDQVNFEIESASAGVLPVPKPITDLLPQTDTVNEILQEAEVELTSVKILEGELVLEGHLLEEGPSPK